MKDDTYLLSLIDAMPRIINQIDRNPASPTFGCCDRDFWHYKIVDFACARKQEAALTLALVASIKHPKNPYYDNVMIRGLADAAIRFWSSIQANDGSFSEWYPNEHSFVATAFSLYAITEALIVSRRSPSPKVRYAILDAAHFLANIVERRVQNQESGAIAALHNASVVLQEPIFAAIAKDRMASLVRQQHPEGWFKEYGGPDIGYLSLTMDYVGKYHDKTGDKNAEALIRRAASFMRWFMHPDGSIGGVYTSRNTEYLIPSAFEHVRDENTVRLSSFCHNGVRSGILPSCRTLTDRYLMYNGYTYAQAFLAQRSASVKPSFADPFDKRFPGCGLRVVDKKSYFIVINEKKGGAFFFNGKRTGTVVQDSGVAVSIGRTAFHAGYLGSASSSDDGSITVTGSLQPIKGQTLSPIKNAALRIFQSTFGISGLLSKTVKERLRDRVITPTNRSHSKFSRSIILGDDSVTVSDAVEGVPDGSTLIVGAKQSTQYVPSARLFVPNDALAQPPLFLKRSDFRRVLR
jgi:hypothetical protein